MTRYDIAKFYGYDSPEEYDEAEKRKHEIFTESKEMQKPNVEKEPVKIQPVSQWISVKDRLPKSEKEVLVWYKYTWDAVSTSYGFGINRWYSNTKQWRNGCLLKGIEVLYWQPLPEPPKEGDTNE